MARTPSPVVAKRNDMIYAKWRRGTSITALAAEHGIARQVAGRIIASYHPELEEDTDRALYRGELWRLYDEIGDVFAAPGWKMAPNGRVAEGPDGEPAIDVNAKIQAGDLRLKVLTELRRLDGRDKQQQKQWNKPDAEESMWAFLAAEKAKIEAGRMDAAERRELEDLRRRAAAIPGEVVRELPPGSA